MTRFTAKVLRERARLIQILVAVSLVGASSAFGEAQVREGIVSKVVGTVKRVKPDPDDLKIESKVSVEDEIHVFPMSVAEIQFDTNISLKLAPGKSKIRERLGERGGLEILLEGPTKLLAYINKARLWIATGNAFMGVFGTVIDVEVLADGTILLRVYEGEVLVESHALVVGAGDQIVIDSNGVAHLPVPIDFYESDSGFHFLNDGESEDSPLLENIVLDIFGRVP